MGQIDALSERRLGEHQEEFKVQNIGCRLGRLGPNKTRSIGDDRSSSTATVGQLRRCLGRPAPWLQRRRCAMSHNGFGSGLDPGSRRSGHSCKNHSLFVSPGELLHRRGRQERWESWNSGFRYRVEKWRWFSSPICQRANTARKTQQQCLGAREHATKV
jgi:hypothetical protein